MTVADVERLFARLERLRSPGRRCAPGSTVADSTVALARPRGDHDLEPDFYEPLRELRRAAVLVPLVAHRPHPTVLFTQRTQMLRDHAGQVAFPGGRIEPTDVSPEAAALREAEEEVGLAAETVRCLGRLDTYVTRTGYEVVPVVALVEPPLTLRLEPTEVAEAFEVPLSFFLTPDARKLMSREFQGRTRQFYAYPYGERFIWGATAGMLNNLVEVLTAGDEA